MGEQHENPGGAAAGAEATTRRAGAGGARGRVRARFVACGGAAPGARDVGGRRPRRRRPARAAARPARRRRPTPAAPKHRLRRFAYAALAVVVGLALLGFGLHERSDASRARAAAASSQRRARALEAGIQVRNQQLAAAQAIVAQLNARLAALAARGKPLPTTTTITHLIDEIPGATRAFRRCADSALVAATEALNFAAAYPTSEARVTAAATAVASVCGQASSAANTLDDLTASATSR